MQKRHKSLIRWILLICFLLSTVSALAVRHYAMITPRSVDTTHSIVPLDENHAPTPSSRWDQDPHLVMGKTNNTQVGLHISSAPQHLTSSLGKNVKARPQAHITGAPIQPLSPPQAPAQPLNPPSAPNNQGKVIVISTSNQWMYMYQNGHQVANTPITTGRPGLNTPAGIFHVFVKESPTTFYSMWPAGSANYFAPTHINFALEFLYPGYFIHDSLWRHDYGPGSNTPHPVPGYAVETGSHGCVNVPYGIMPWLYNWADINTMVQILA